MATLTISDAARRCGVARRTLQRAIRTGRLTLTTDHRLTLDALHQAGYVPVTASQQRVTATPPRQDDTSQGAPRDASRRLSQAVTQDLSQVVSAIVERLDRLIPLLETLCHMQEQHHAAATDRG